MEAAMNINRRPTPRSANSSTSPDRMRSPSTAAKIARPASSGSESSASSNVTSLSVAKRAPYQAQTPNLPNFTNLERANHSTSSLTGYPHRPSAQYMPNDGTRRTSPQAPPADFHKHRPRQHSQGFFEPSLPSASLSDHAMGTLSASQIAAQAAFQHQNAASHLRKRSQTIPNPQEEAGQTRRTSKGSITPLQSSPDDSSHSAAATFEQQYRNGLIGNNAAATAASAAFPRSTTPLSTVLTPAEGPEKESKKGLKRFRPRNIGISRDKEPKEKPLPSPVKIISGPSGLSQVMNASQTSLAETVSSSASSAYNLTGAHSATSSVLSGPGIDRILTFEKEKPHKHHGLRQKLKLKDKDDHHLPLSSASSNSRPLDANNPTSLYSFAPASPGPTSGFSKSVSGLDLRHAGRALREKKKEERANALETSLSRGETESSEFTGLGIVSSLSGHSASVPFLGGPSHGTDPATKDILAGFGLNNMTADDAWDFLKAKILVIFEGAEVRIAVEDLNRLVTVHLQKCVQKHMPSVIVEDLGDLFHTGFMSLNHTLRQVPDERLVPHLVNMWLFVFGRILPYMQAVFLPLDLEFKGRGTILSTPQAAAEFWGVLPNSSHGGALSSSPPMDGPDGVTPAGEELEVRRTLLIAFRDNIILPRYNVLKATFSRLSLESIDAGLAALTSTTTNSSNSDANGNRPGTSQSLDPNFSSYNSQSSTLLGTLSSAGRSRATSNTSNPALQEVAFESFSSPPAARPSDSSSALVTETVGRMLQCVSVLASVQSGDQAQNKVEELARELKLNWLGRGRTGRNRRGFVGTKIIGDGTGAVKRISGTGTGRSGDTIIPGAARDGWREREREGSPTPTPTRAGTFVTQQAAGGERGEDPDNVGGRPHLPERKRRSML